MIHCYILVKDNPEISDCLLSLVVCIDSIPPSPPPPPPKKVLITQALAVTGWG